MTESCYNLHTKRCQGQVQCLNCKSWIVTHRRKRRQGESLEDKIKQHQCFEKQCKTCHLKLENEEEFKQHTCALSLPSFPRYFSSIGVFDIETAQYGNNGTHEAMLLCYSYERAFGAIFQDIAFGATGFEHPLLNSIQKPYIAGNYLPDSVTNIISKDGTFKPPAVSRKRKRPLSPSGSIEEVENEFEDEMAAAAAEADDSAATKNDVGEQQLPAVERVDLEVALENHDWKNEMLLDYAAYKENLINFHHKVSPATRKSPIYKFLAFTLNHRHAGRCILSMYGARFDMVFVADVLFELNFKCEILPVGTGLIMLKIPFFNQVYLDAYKFFQQPLAKLPKRFGLPDEKGLFCFAYNKYQHWNLVKKDPPDFSYYVNPYKDDEKTKAAKKDWYDNVKSKEEYFDFNNDCVLYCKLDVKVLLLALIKFLSQSFPFQDLLVQRYGPSPAWKKGKMPYIHMFTQQTTVGSYR